MMLSLKKLDVRYGPIRALREVSIEVAEGEIVTLLGANGAGKSTALRTISGLVRPSAGEILFEGDSLATMAPHDIVRRGVSHAPEGRRVFPYMSVAENLEMGAYQVRGREQIRKAFDDVLQLFPRLAERRTQQAGTLSGGEQQMLAIGRALMTHPKLLLLDEPSLGLAPNLVHAIFDVIRDINARGVTILLVEQNAHLALRAANRGYVLETGSVALADTAKALEANPEVRAAYLGE